MAERGESELKVKPTPAGGIGGRESAKEKPLNISRRRLSVRGHRRRARGKWGVGVELKFVLRRPSLHISSPNDEQ